MFPSDGNLYKKRNNNNIEIIYNNTKYTECIRRRHMFKFNLRIPNQMFQHSVINVN